MQARTRRGQRARWIGGAAAVALALAGCAGSSGDGGPEPTDPGGSKASPSSTMPEPSESARLYTQENLTDDVEGDAASANTAVRDFARAISTGDRETVDGALHAPTPEDPSVIDQTMRAFSDVSWDESSLRWTETGVLGPCYLLMGEGKDGPVHLAGTAAWNDAEGEWEFTTAGFPGSAEYPELPTC